MTYNSEFILFVRGVRMRIRGWIHFKQCVNLETPIVADVLLTAQ